MIRVRASRMLANRVSVYCNPLQRSELPTRILFQLIAIIIDDLKMSSRRRHQ
jgi:hypothetical protein